MYFHLTDTTGAVLYSTIPIELREYFYTCEVENEQFLVESRKYRHGKMSVSNGVVYAITDDTALINRTRYFKERLEALTHLLPIISQIEKRVAVKTTAHTKRLVHNLESLNGHNIQELYKLISEKELRETPQQERKQLIEQKIKEQQSRIHRTVQNLVKNNASMKMEFSVFNKLMTGKVGKLEKQPHPLKKALMNVAHIFFQDFGEKGVDVKVDESELFIFVDYECFQVSFYQLFDNATKYVLPETDINIGFTTKGNVVTIEVSMISVKIEDEEVEKILQDGYCGKNAKLLGVNGKGIGMLNLKKTLELNKGTLKIDNCVDQNTITFSDIPYEKNIFSLTLPIFRK